MSQASLVGKKSESEEQRSVVKHLVVEHRPPRQVLPRGVPPYQKNVEKKKRWEIAPNQEPLLLKTRYCTTSITIAFVFNPPTSIELGLFIIVENDCHVLCRV